MDFNLHLEYDVTLDLNINDDELGFDMIFSFYYAYNRRS